ncbi:MAG: lysoplasmalogenase [Acidimicrobiia bacterium]|nr:lysoplasmalogenase [Acidimicrobiia bacterium]NNF68358.1 lysoplasmalogenase [Acidimicrobiia bacterium]
MIALVVGCGLAVVALVMAERHHGRARIPAKIVASSCFVAVAAVNGAADTTFGTWIIIGLALSWLGDVSLLGGGRGPFALGLTFFLTAHLAYVVAFVVRPAGEGWVQSPSSSSPVLVITVIAVLVVGVVAGRWILPRVDTPLVWPVAAYMVVISVMVLAAGGTVGVDWDARILTGAVLFYLSDIAVARDRFISPGWENRLVGLPLYYAGQVLLAIAAGG